jgi:hypothetical protein
VWPPVDTMPLTRDLLAARFSGLERTESEAMRVPSYARVIAAVKDFRSCIDRDRHLGRHSDRVRRGAVRATCARVANSHRIGRSTGRKSLLIRLRQHSVFPSTTDRTLDPRPSSWVISRRKPRISIVPLRRIHILEARMWRHSSIAYSRSGQLSCSASGAPAIGPDFSALAERLRFAVVTNGAGADRRAPLAHYSGEQAGARRLRARARAQAADTRHGRARGHRFREAP